MIPILYDVPKGTHDHSRLHATLHKWAETYATGSGGKTAIVAEHAKYPPQPNTVDDYVVSRMLWALKSKPAAKLFAEMEPVPPIEWLEVFDKYRLDEEGCSDKEGSFSFMHKLVPSEVQIVAPSERWANLDDSLFQIARWLLRHLDNPKLILWISSKGGILHPQFKGMIW